jgi:antitoxin component YwqK of YwqJK toxin-antitoxin module
MKVNLFPGILIILILLFAGCNGKSGGWGNSGSDTLSEGEKPVYSENGKLHFLVTKKDGKANGRVREYYSDGKLYMDAIYKDDHRHGKCTHYFKNGKPFSVSYFVNGAKDSIETKFYESGEVLAYVPYKKDKVQPGLKEFKRDGTQIDDNKSLVISEVDHTALEGKYFVYVSLPSPRKNAKFYASPESDPRSREVLKISNGKGVLVVPVSRGGFIMKKLLFEAEYKTPRGNTMRVQRSYNLAVDG